MGEIKKAVLILTDKGGVSLMILLATMLFLITAATSTLTAALSTANVIEGRTQLAQIDLFAQSIRYTLATMLNDTTEPLASNNLQTELVTTVYAHDSDSTNLLYDSLEINVEEILPDGTIKNHTFECEIDMTDLRVLYTGEVAGVLNITATIGHGDTLAEEGPGSTARYAMSFKLSGAQGNEDFLTNYGTWELQNYAKITD